MKCKKCEREFDGNFCPECGEPVVKKCKNCGKELEDTDVFCRNCGESVDGKAQQTKTISTQRNNQPYQLDDIVRTENIASLKGANSLCKGICWILLLISLLFWITYLMPTTVLADINCFDLVKNLRNEEVFTDEEANEINKYLFMFYSLFVVTGIFNIVTLTLTLVNDETRFKSLKCNEENTQLKALRAKKNRFLIIAFFSIVLFICSVTLDGSLGILSGRALSVTIALSVLGFLLSAGFAFYAYVKAEKASVKINNIN